MATRNVDKSNLGYLGTDFQYKLAKYFIEDNNFFNQISNIVDQNAFTDPLLRTFVGTIKDYYNKESIVPSYSTMEIALRAKSNSEIEIREWEELIEKLNEYTYEGSSLIKDNAIKFFKQQKLIKAANKMLEKVGKGDIEQFDECQSLIKDALETDAVDDFGYSIFDLEEQALSDDYTVSIPTGISGLDDVLGGGLDKKKVGLIIGGLGFGKTTLTTAIAAAAASAGFNVVQIYFEDDDVDITRKHFSRITDKEAFEFKRLSPDEKQKVQAILANHPDREKLARNLRLKSFVTGETTVADIRSFIIKLTNKGFKPDLVTLDYFECLQLERTGFNAETEWTREGITMRKIESMAKELDVAIWIPSQGNRDSLTADVVTVDKNGGSIKKGQIAQVIISIARTPEDAENNRATLALLKNRSGKGSKLFRNIYFDNGKSTVRCDEVEELDGLKEWEEIQNDIEQKTTNQMARLVQDSLKEDRKKIKN